jgi:hypothetical protein
MYLCVVALAVRTRNARGRVYRNTESRARVRVAVLDAALQRCHVNVSCDGGPT